MRFNLHKLNDNTFEFINSKGERKVYTKEQLNTFVSNGAEIFVDNVKYLLKPDAKGQIQPDKIYELSTNDNRSFTFKNKPISLKGIIENLIRGKTININGNRIKLNRDQTGFVYVDPKIEQQHQNQFKITKENVDAILASAPVNSMPVTAKNIATDANGNFIYNNRIITKQQIIAGLKRNHYLTLNGKLLELNKEENDFVIIDPDAINAALRAQENKPAIDLEYVSYERFFYPEKNKNVGRAPILRALKNKRHIRINKRELAITPDGLDFAYVEDVAKMKEGLKPLEQVKQEAEAAGVTIVNVPLKLKSYFTEDVSVEEEQKQENKPANESESYKKMRDLQKRLFMLSADSNMINVNSEKSNDVFDFAKFIEQYNRIAPGKKVDIFKELFGDENIVFDLSGKSQTCKKLWQWVLKFSTMVNDVYRETGDDYLNLAYPFVSDIIIDENKNPPEEIEVNAPLFLLRTKLIVDQKNKTFSLLLAKEKQQFAFKANKELLLYLATELNKQINTSKYKELFDDNIFSPIDNQIKMMKAYFDELNIAFDENRLLNIIDKMENSKFVPLNSEVKLKAKQNQVPSINITSNCFIGIFKTLNSEIYKDYDKILEKQEGREFSAELNALVPDQLKYYIEKGRDFQESSIRQIVALDYSQKVACKLAMDNSINIVGPAGTGKSQTISNILANIIARHNSALFVAEKKTATDVVFNRLKSLRNYVLPLYDQENWVEKLTKSIRQCLKRVGDIYGKWDALGFNDKDSQLDYSSNKIDEQFELIRQNRKLMGTRLGHEYPKTIIDFSAPDKKELIKAIDQYCLTEFNKSQTSKEFWEVVRKTKLEKELYAHCMVIINSIRSELIRTNPENIDKLFKVLKYYDSKTLFNDEMVQIIQNPYDDQPITPTPSDKINWDKLDSYKSEAIYQDFYKEVNDKIQADTGVLKLIKDYKGFVTKGLLDTIGKRIQSTQNPQNRQQNLYTNQYGVNITANQQPNWGVNPYGTQNGYGQQNNQYSSQQSVDQPPLGYQPYANPQQSNLTGVQNPGQQPQVPNYQQYPQFDTRTPVEIFADKYNESSFPFGELKQYFKLREQFGETNSDIIHLDASKWFNETNDELNKKINIDFTFCELDFLTYVRQQISTNMVYASQYNKLYGIVDNCERIENVEEILQNFGAILALLFPVVIASPNLVSKYIKASHGLFDHVVIDEASMLSLEKAIPILFRGKKYCIVGDSKQLQPLSYLEQLRKLSASRKLYAQDKISKEELLNQQKLVNEYKGVLDFMAPHIQKTTLQYHYRATKTECVKFSSVAFYDNEMIIADNFTDKDEYQKAGLRVYQVNGEYKNGINKVECVALYKELETIAKMNKQIVDNAKKISVGIIVFTQAQKEYLDNMIQTKADPDVLALSLMLNPETGEDNSLFIKDVETVQGDERDVILMSLGSSSKNKSEIVHSLGLLNSDLGPNFLNVMTTRARKAMIIFKSFHAEDIPNTGVEAINYYRDFIQYIDYLVNKDDSKTKSLIENLFKKYQLKSATINYSVFSLYNVKTYLSKYLFDKFAKHIDRNKYEIEQDYSPIQGQDFGMVVKDKHTHIPEFALIFDEFIRDLYKTAKQSQFYDYLFLGSRGWVFNKVTALEWCDLVDSAKSEKEINDFIKAKLTFQTKDGIKCYYIDEPVDEPVKAEQVVKDIFEKTQDLFPGQVKTVKKSTKKAKAKKAAKKPKKSASKRKRK